MGIVFIALLGFWLVGGYFSVSKRLRNYMLGFGIFTVSLGYVFFLQDHWISLKFGGSLGLWLLLWAVVIAAVLYSNWIKQLRKKVMKTSECLGDDIDKETLSEAEIERYARHLIVRDIGGEGQKKLKTARVLVIGAGALGSPVLIYLAASGVGHLGIMDDDLVSLSNLQRQIIHANRDIESPKIISAAQKIKNLNPHVNTQLYQRRFIADSKALLLFQDYDLIIDCSDNLKTRFAVSKVALKADKPIISGALGQWDGQVGLFFPKNNSPCWGCLHPNMTPDDLELSCSDIGVVAALPGIIGSIMAIESLKYIVKSGKNLLNKIMIYDGLTARVRVLDIKKHAQCQICQDPKEQV